MVGIKNSTKNSVVLHRSTGLKAKTSCKPRWSSKHCMVARFCKIHAELVKVALEPELTLDFEGSASQLAASAKARAWMGETNEVTVSLQEHHLPLSVCNACIETIKSAVDEKQKVRVTANNPNMWCKCPLKISKALTTYDRLNPDSDFLTGVIKIQQGDWRSLTAREKIDCACLLKTSVDLDDEDDSNNGDGQKHQQASPDMVAKLKRAREGQQTSDRDCPYINCDFIFGSAAQVEWLWSLAKLILTSQRARLTPRLFETLLFLKVNRRFWNEATILEAMEIARDGASSERLRKMIAEQLQQGTVLGSNRLKRVTIEK